MILLLVSAALAGPFYVIAEPMVMGGASLSNLTTLAPLFSESSNQLPNHGSFEAAADCTFWLMPEKYSWREQWLLSAGVVYNSYYGLGASAAFGRGKQATGYSLSLAFEAYDGNIGTSRGYSSVLGGAAFQLPWFRSNTTAVGFRATIMLGDEMTPFYPGGASHMLGSKYNLELTLSRIKNLPTADYPWPD